MDGAMSEEGINPGFIPRLRLFALALVVGFGSLLVRLWFVQVRHGEEHAQAIARQSVRRIRLSPVRGRIWTRDEHLMVDNRPAYDVVFHIAEMRRPGRRRNTTEHILEQALHIARLIKRPMPLTAETLSRHMSWYPALPLTIFTDLAPRELAQVGEMFPPVPGMEIVARIVRRYPWPGVATHVLGFTGRAHPPDSFERSRFSYVGRELRGRNGLELLYDSELAGRGGAKLVRIDLLGFVHAEIGTPDMPRNGRDLILTLDAKAQVVADRLLKEQLDQEQQAGALVMVNVHTGAVLAVASSPSYDIGQLGGALYGRLREDVVRMPLVNRAVGAVYDPGSIIKPLVGLAALEAGVITPAQEYLCTGSYEVGDTPIRCWNRWGHGYVALVEAIAQSCNPYFLHAGVATGLRRLQPIFAAAGIGESPNIDLPFAARGLLPSREYAREHWQRDWIMIDTAYASIGQGAVRLSPLQAALMAAAIANGGALYRPYLVQSVRTAEGAVLRNAAPVVESRLPVRQEHLALIREGMNQAVNDEHGTAKAARNSAIAIAGKTGTAEVGVGDERYKDTWFIGFGPMEAPQYAVAVLIERGVTGGRTAAPLAGRFFEQWLSASPVDRW